MIFIMEKLIFIGKKVISIRMANLNKSNIKDKIKHKINFQI